MAELINTMWKFEPEGMDPVIEMPDGAIIQAVGHQYGALVFWARVDPSAVRVLRRFHVVGTGWDFDASHDYLGMAQFPNGVVWHLLEEKL